MSETVLNTLDLNSSPPDPHPVVAAILAAGLSRRMGAVNKLVQEVDGIPIVRRVVQHVLASDCARVMVVLGHQADDVRAVLTGLPVEFVENPEYQEGLAASVRAAVRATTPGEALLICLGDMPKVPDAVINRLIQVYRNTFATHRGDPRDQAEQDEPDADSVAGRQSPEHSENWDDVRDSVLAFQPEFEGRRGNPVLWSPQAVPLLTGLSGDEGAKAILKRLGNAVMPVPVKSSGILLDIDTPQALTEARRHDWPQVDGNASNEQS